MNVQHQGREAVADDESISYASFWAEGAAIVLTVAAAVASVLGYMPSTQANNDDPAALPCVGVSTPLQRDLDWALEPDASELPGQSSHYVREVDKDGTVAQKQVQIGELRVIRSGLANTDQVVGAVPATRPGTKVTTRTEAIAFDGKSMPCNEAQK